MKLSIIFVLLSLSLSGSYADTGCANNNTFIVEFSLVDNEFDFMLIEEIPTKIKNKEFVRLSSSVLPYLCKDIISNFDHIVHLEFYRLSLTEIEKRVFENLTSLETLEISNNYLIEIGDGIFSGLPLKELSLENNGIRAISSNAFAGMRSLRSLKLQSNRLTTINSYWFNRKHSLNHVDLSHNLIGEVPRNAFLYLVSKSKNCRLDSKDVNDHCPIIDLSYNNLTSINEDAFNRLKYVDSIILDDNQLSDLPFLPLNIHLRVLSVQHNDITYVYTSELKDYVNTIDKIYMYGNPIYKRNLDDFAEENDEIKKTFIFDHRRQRDE